MERPRYVSYRELRALGVAGARANGVLVAVGCAADHLGRHSARSDAAILQGAPTEQEPDPYQSGPARPPGRPPPLRTRLVRLRVYASLKRHSSPPFFFTILN